MTLRVPEKTRAGAAALALVLAGPAAAACPSELSNTFFPLPVYATLPNEGDTWGILPVLLRVCPDTKRTESILAPSLTWNSVIRYTMTFRWYYYPTDDSALTTMASVSTKTNYNNLVTWVHRPTPPGEWTDEVLVRVQRNVFERFFGIGPLTHAGAESSYTSLRFLGSVRRGLNLAPNLNLGATIGFEYDAVERIGVPNLPLTPDAFPDAPGIHGATVASQGLDLRFDNRRGGDYAERGVSAELGGAVVEGISGSPTYLRGNAQVRSIWRELPRLSGAARAYWTGVTSSEAPFYQQSSLGGSFTMRGFTERRFVDRQAWTVELEQRIEVLPTQLFGVVTDWRIDPFVAAGQVFDGWGEIGSRVQLAVGLGFRAFVRPNVLGRVDLGYAGEGAKFYVELGYPF